MRRVVVSAGRGVTVEQAGEPVPAAGEALVAMTAAGVCGSDLHAVKGRHPFVALPYAPGHEVVGVVEALGPGTAGPAPGRRVVVEPTLPCRTCKQCRRGVTNLCENLRFFGCGYDQGGMADYFTVPVDRLHPVPDELDDHQAALVEPLSTPVHAARLAGPVDGRAVAILGAGTIGLLLLATVLQHGARRVVVTDLLPRKRELAARLGAHAVVDAASSDVVRAVRDELGESADVVFDCVAVQATVDQGIAMALKGGTVAVVGVPAAPVTVPLPEIQDLQVRLQGSATYLPEDYDESVALLTAGHVRAADIVTATYPLAEAPAAFEAAASGTQVKVLLENTPG